MFLLLKSEAFNSSSKAKIPIEVSSCSFSNSKDLKGISISVIILVNEVIIEEYLLVLL